MSFETEKNLGKDISFEKCSVSNPMDAAGVVDYTLQEIWFSSPMLTYDELVENVTQATPFKPEAVTRVVDHMLNYDVPVIQRDEQDKMVFTAVGRGCIETSRMFNEELDPLDCTYSYISEQAKGFFKTFVSDLGSESRDHASEPITPFIVQSAWKPPVCENAGQQHEISSEKSSDKDVQQLEAFPENLTTMVTPVIHHRAFAELVQLGWLTMPVPEVTALSRIIEAATKFGYQFALYEAEYGLPQNNNEVAEMASMFGLEYKGMQYIAEQRPKNR